MKYQMLLLLTGHAFNNASVAEFFQIDRAFMEILVSVLKKMMPKFNDHFFIWDKTDGYTEMR